MTNDLNSEARPRLRLVKIQDNLIRDTYIDHIAESLEKSRLSLDDFDISIEKVSTYRQESGSTTFALAASGSGKKLDGARVLIKCNFQDNYYFAVDIYQNFYIIKHVPGEVLMSAAFEVTAWDKVVEAISEWVDTVYWEITRHPVSRTVVELTEEVEGILKIINGLPDRFFTKEEGEELTNRLNRLESDFRAYYEASREEQTNDKAQIKQLEKEMEFLRASVLNLTQKNWGRLFANRLSRMLNSPAGQAVLSSGVSSVIKGLIEGPKQ